MHLIFMSYPFLTNLFEFSIHLMKFESKVIESKALEIEITNISEEDTNGPPGRIQNVSYKPSLLDCITYMFKKDV